MNHDYSLIKETLKDRLITHYAAHSSLKSVNISSFNKKILQEVGLPLVQSSQGINFLPFTFYQLIEVESKEIYLLGDIGSSIMGTDFIGLELNSERLYYFSQNAKRGMNIQFFNGSLYKFLMCFTVYTRFIQNNEDFYELPKEQMKKKYQDLKDNITNIDNEAMRDQNNYWWHLMYDISMEIVAK